MKQRSCYGIIKVLSGGGVFLPREVRESIGLQPLESLVFTLERDAIVIRKVQQPEYETDPVEETASADIVLIRETEACTITTSEQGFKEPPETPLIKSPSNGEIR